MDVRHPRQAVMSISPDDPEPMYRIGTVSRLTGIATVTLRMWERRYNVVDPGRSSGRNRLYSRDDIARLALIKRLVDAGHSISTVAGLTLVQLHERLEVQEKPRQLAALPVRVLTPVRVAVLGDALPARIARAGSELAGLAIVASQRERARFLADAPAQEPQVLVIEVPALGPETAAEAPIRKVSCPQCMARKRAAPAAEHSAEKRRKRAAPNRRATTEPKTSSHKPLMARWPKSACTRA